MFLGRNATIDFDKLNVLGRIGHEVGGVFFFFFKSFGGNMARQSLGVLVLTQHTQEK